MQEKKLAKLFERYHRPSHEIALKMLTDLGKATPKEVGEAVLSTKMPGQNVKVAVQRLELIKEGK